MYFACERDHRLPPLNVVALATLTGALLLCWLVLCSREPAFAPPSLAEALPRLGESIGAAPRPAASPVEAAPADPVLSTLQQPVQAESSDALFRASQVLDRCSTAARPDTLRFSERAGVAAAQQRALEQRLDWCEVTLGYLLSGADGDPNQLRLRALHGGSLLAEANALDILAARHGVAYAEDLAREFLATGDPEFIVAVASWVADRPAGYAPAVPGLDLQFLGPERRTLLFELAAQSLACGFGQDCGIAGALMQDYCIELGICYTSFDHAAERELLSPRDFERMLGLRDALQAGIATGDYGAFGL